MDRKWHPPGRPKLRAVLLLAGGADAEFRQRFPKVLDEGFRIVDVGARSDPSRRRYGLDFVELKLAGYIFDDFGADGALLLDKPVDERMLAEEIHHARHA